MASGLFGGGGYNSIPTTTKVELSLPGWVEGGSQEVYDKAKPLADRGYPGYPTGDRIAPLTADQLRSFDLIRDSVDNWRPYIDKGSAAIDASRAPIGKADIDAYMNPYTDEVINASLDRVLTQANRDRINRNASLANRGSFLNEDRRAVIDNVANEGTNRVVAELVANLKASGFNAALAQANTQRNREAGAASLYNQYGASVQQATNNDANALFDSGSAQQAQEQQNRSIRYEDFIKDFYYPQEQLNWLMSLLSGLPYGQTQTTTGMQLVPQGNALGGLLGGAASIAGLGNSFGFWGPGTANAALGGGTAAAGFSPAAGALLLSTEKSKDIHGDARGADLVERFKKLGVKAWSYKPELGDTALHVGPTAEDFRDVFEIGDGQTIHIADSLGVLMGAVKELVERVTAMEGVPDAA